jgi:hypothetical protein
MAVVNCLKQAEFALDYTSCIVYIARRYPILLATSFPRLFFQIDSLLRVLDYIRNKRHSAVIHTPLGE